MKKDDKARNDVLEMIKSAGGYTVIPDIFLKLKLKPIQLLLLSVAHRYSQSGRTYKASYKDLKENYSIARMTAVNNINSLVSAGILIKKTGDSKTDNAYSVNYSTIKELLERQSKNDTSTKISLVQKLDYPSTEIRLASTKTRLEVVQKLDPYNTIYNTSNNTVKEYAQKDIAQLSVSTSQKEEKDSQPDRVDRKKEPARSHKKKDTAIYEKQFETFWKEYPKKRDRKKALEKWLKLKPDEELFKKIMQAVQSWKKSDDWQKDGGQFIPYPTSWLNGERWNDEAPAPPKQSRRSAQEYIPKADPIYQHTQEPIPDI